MSTRRRRTAQALSERIQGVERAWRWPVVVLCALVVLTAGGLPPAHADEPARYAPGLAAVAAGRHLHLLIELGARYVARAQRAGELPADRDAEFLAAATLGGTNAILSVVLTRTP